MRLAATLLLLLSWNAMAALTTKKVSWELDGAPYEGVLIADDKGPARPGLVMVPNWLGVTDEAVKQGELVAARGYVVLVADVYGTKNRPKNFAEAGKSAGALKGDRAALRLRMTKALEVLLAQKSVKLDTTKVGAIGFCFGGTAALELAERHGLAVIEDDGSGQMGGTAIEPSLPARLVDVPAANRREDRRYPR